MTLALRDRSARRLLCGWFVVRRIKDDTAAKPFAVTFSAQVCMITQGQVDDTPLARRHRREVEGGSRLAHFFGGDRGGHTQFFEPQGTLILAIKRNLLVFA